jgi:hypothetical protein
VTYHTVSVVVHIGLYRTESMRLAEASVCVPVPSTANNNNKILIIGTTGDHCDLQRIMTYLVKVGGSRIRCVIKPFHACIEHNIFIGNIQIVIAYYLD